tara:strand:- start:90 stop:692 length:603 start_codon:yes stop_codon:yes gene_type:complete
VGGLIPPALCFYKKDFKNMNLTTKLSMLLTALMMVVGCSNKKDEATTKTPVVDNEQVEQLVLKNYEALREFYPKEFDTIMEAAEANDCTRPELICILFAIRTAENGRKGIEFGVLHPRAIDQPNSLRVQAGWCAATVSKNYKRWIDSRGKNAEGENVDFITFLGNRYCPVGADNDPNGLNKHWIPNVIKITVRNADAIYK